MTTPALRVDPIQDHPPVLTEEPLPCTVESEVVFTDPQGAYQIGYSSGMLWAIANPADPPIGASPWSLFVAYWSKHRLRPGADTIRQMAAALSRNENITDEQARNYLSTYTPGFPSGLAAVQMYLDGFYWGVVEAKKQQREQRRRAWEAKRERDREHIARYGHLAPHSDF